MTADRVAEVRPSLQEVVGSGIKPLRTFNVLPAIQLATFYFNEVTGMAEITGIQTRFDASTGILTVTDRSARVYAKLQDLFNGIRLATPEVDRSILRPPPTILSGRIKELVAA